jgi:hypothetical protein
MGGITMDKIVIISSTDRSTLTKPTKLSDEEWQDLVENLTNEEMEAFLNNQRLFLESWELYLSL